jgi:hypothetical protein
LKENGEKEKLMDKEDERLHRRSRRSSVDPNYRLPGRSKSKDDKRSKDPSRSKNKLEDKIPRPPPQSSKNSGMIKVQDPRVRRYRLSKTVRVGENGVEEEDKEVDLGSGKGTRL